MQQLKDAKIVLRILKENGYEAYMVGGAVRDYLLNIELNDIDITTSAKPYQVGKIFKTVPTGLKYGTVTVLFKDSKFEVTTFRKEAEFTNHRHPEEIDFEVTVEDDVKRRDFTMNGLIMDDKGLIIDYVDGKQAIRDKLITTIGDPNERFHEDALRMLRAFHFESKLGFTIDPATKAAIKENIHLIKSISGERVLHEMLKIVQGKHLKQTLNSMIETNIHTVLPGLQKGIEFFAKEREMPLTDIFFSLSFVLNKTVPVYWKFTNRHRHKYNTVIKLVNEKTEYGAKDIYEHGLEYCQAANRVNYILGKSELKSLTLAKMFEELPISSELDLKFRARDILNVTKRKAGAWVNKLLTQMVYEVLDGNLKNDYEEQKAYVLANHELL